MRFRPTRPERFPSPSGWAALPGTLAEVEYLGAVTRFIVRLADGTPLHLVTFAAPIGADEVALAYDPARVVVLGDEA